MHDVWTFERGVPDDSLFFLNNVFSADTKSEVAVILPGTSL